jgi:hypothetical protein
MKINKVKITLLGVSVIVRFDEISNRLAVIGSSMKQIKSIFF